MGWTDVLLGGLLFLVAICVGLLLSDAGPKLAIWIVGRLNGSLNAAAHRTWRKKGSPAWGVWHPQLGWKMRGGGFMPFVVTSKEAAGNVCKVCGGKWRVKRFKDYRT